jgi:hypothetical protein
LTVLGEKKRKLERYNDRKKDIREGKKEHEFT